MSSSCSEGFECALQESLAQGKVRCNTCSRHCELSEGETGWCRTRTVRKGRLYTLTYGRLSSLSLNPIEKKPFYHFFPGSCALTAGSWSCNFACPWCQNWRISKNASGADRFMSPADFVEEAIGTGADGTSVSFNEPSLSLEWAVEAFGTARQRGPDLYHTFVTNGYVTPEALRLLAEAGLDAMNVDIKGNAAVYEHYCAARDRPVWETCRLARELGLHIEITTLVIPGVNDDHEMLRGIASRIADELGTAVPWHLTAYSPAYRFRAPPTPQATLDRARENGRDVGLDFVYLGNVRGSAGNTHCPSCGRLLVQRDGMTLVSCEVTPSGHCPACGRNIPGVGWGRSASG